MITALLEDCIRYYISRDLPVSLEGLGILFPRARTIERSYQRGEQLIVRKETNRTIEFEKCSNLSQFHRERYRGLIETNQLAQRLYALLPVHKAVDSSEREMRAQIDSVIATITHEVIEQGFSSTLSSLGTFYSLHNRQGENFDDWFAGADIFMSSLYAEPIAAARAILGERPVLESSWELLQAAYGEPLTKMTVDLPKQLEALGYDVAAFPKDIERAVSCAVFQTFDSREKVHYLVYCTDGLRKVGLNAKKSKGFGNEIVFQLPIGSVLDPTKPRDLSAIPLWPHRALTMAWILMQSSPSRTVRAGLKMTEGVPLVPDSDSELSSIFTTHFAAVREEQLSTEGPFFYVNVVGITQEEHQLAESNGSDFLRTILEYKKLLQFTKPLRSSVVSRSRFSSKAQKVTPAYILSDPRIAHTLRESRASVPA